MNHRSMRKNPARTAWTVLLLSFCVFCFLVISIPLSIRWYVLHAQEDWPGTLRVTSGTVLLVINEADEPVAVVDTRQVDGDTLIQTDQSSQASLVFLANQDPDSPELATVQIYPTTQVRLVNSHRPRYPLSGDPNTVQIEVRHGRVRVNRSNLEPRGLTFDVTTPHGEAHLGPGSYGIQVTNDQTQVATRIGEAQVDAQGKRVIVVDGLTTTVATNEAPSPPLETSDNLLANGDFQEPLGPPTWLVSHYPEDDPSAGQAEVVTIGDRQAVEFRRINQPPTHTEVGITQVVERNVHDYESLNLQMDVMLRWQSLPGAGEQSSEFPLMLWLDYVDIYGNHQFWTHGFYYQDPPEQWVVTGGQKIPSNVWFPFESGNLFERLTMEGRPAPATINWIKVYASGHNYDSMASEIRLVAR
jgi:hypothetical protein